ncbi:hypothetical protein KKG52_02600 [Patescibacteria group bacterium]|nr:hypothetical protein [Patescibacteria group bacterium]
MTERRNSRLKERKIKPPSTIVYAGDSPRRKYFLECIFPNSKIITSYAGIENQAKPTAEIVKEKIGFVRRKLGPVDGLVVAADIKTQTLSLATEGHGFLKDRAKVSKEYEIKEIFADMANASRKIGIAPYYHLFSSSRAENRKERASHCTTNTIELDPEAVGVLGTETGHNYYLEMFERFYDSCEYKSNGKLPPAKPTDLSAGISLSVLNNIDAVISIDGVRKGTIGYKETLRSAIFNAGVSFSPHTLKPFIPDIDERIKNWEWLSAMVAQSLKKQTPIPGMLNEILIFPAA